MSNIKLGGLDGQGRMKCIHTSTARGALTPDEWNAINGGWDQDFFCGETIMLVGERADLRVGGLPPLLGGWPTVHYVKTQITANRLIDTIAERDREIESLRRALAAPEAVPVSELRAVMSHWGSRTPSWTCSSDIEDLIARHTRRAAALPGEPT